MKRFFGKIGLGLATLTLLAGGWGVSHPAVAQNPAPAMPQGNMAGDHAAMMMKMMNARPKELKKADRSVMQAKATATKKGMYNCCLKHPCDWCALKMGACPCGKNAATSMPVCNECKGGWAAGDGAIPGKTADDIKTMPRMDMKMGGATETAPKVAGITDLWRCPITGEAVSKEHETGTPVVVGNYRVHFCCGGCPETFAKLSETEKQAKVTAVAKK